MAALTLKSIRLCTLALGVALALGSPALAGDVSVKLDAGAGFSVKNNTGAIERLRVDEATGNVSRNGSLFVHTTGVSNTSIFVGVKAGNTSTGSFSNSAFGYYALFSNTTGFRNTAIGESALHYNTTGSYNSAVGVEALLTNTTGDGNSAFGNKSLQSNTTGDFNSALGYGALRSNTTGFNNSALGLNALTNNTTGNRNSAFGRSALHYNTTGNLNSAVGYAALRSNTTGSSNSAVGYSALRSNTSGTENSAFGYDALRSNLTSGKNSAFGLGSLENSTGIGNTGIGRWALRFTTSGNYNVALGMNAGVNQTTGNNNIYLKNDGVAGESGQIKIGTAGAHTKARIAGIRGVTTDVADAIPVLIDSAGQLGTVSSSRRVKKEIRDMGDATARLLELRPVTYRYKQEQTLPSRSQVPPEYGLIAEEVAEVFPDLVVYDEAGKPFTVKYHEMAPMLLNEMKKQQQTIEAQRQQYEEEIAALTTRLAQLETRVSGAPGDAQR